MESKFTEYAERNKKEETVKEHTARLRNEVSGFKNLKSKIGEI